MAELFENLPFENLYWNQMETVPQEELREIQVKRLRRTVERVKDLPLYQSFFKENPLTDDDFQVPEDVQKLPFTTLADLRSQKTQALWTVPRHEIARIQTQDGIQTAFTRRDLLTQADLTARFLYADGTRSNNLVQISHPFGRPALAFALQSGVDCIGAASIPAGELNSPDSLAVPDAALKLEEMFDFLTSLNVDGICADAEFVFALCSQAQASGLKLPLKYAHIPATESGIQLRYPIQKNYGLKVWEHWEHSAFFGAGLAGECHLQDGLHLQEDRFLFECLDPETLEAVPEGKPGELIVTDLFHEAQSLLRFRTGVVACLNSAPCPCGRTGRRIQIVKF